MKKIIVTGAAGFIGSAFVWKLNQEGIDDIIIVDNLADSQKWKNISGLKFFDYIHKNNFLSLIEEGNSFLNENEVSAIVHMGACSSTTQTDADYLIRNNYNYSRTLLHHALTHNLRFIYASSAATYGNGQKGFSDHDEKTPAYLPINMYGYSKQLFDLWVLKQNLQNQVAGLKFFNVYGPNEYHKGDMSSMVFKAYHQILEKGNVNLFKSMHPDYKDGEQKRDFVYIKDVVAVMYQLLQTPQANGIFNVGNGKAVTWLELMRAVFQAMGKQENINFIDMPKNLQNSYQYFTKADTNKLEKAIDFTFTKSLQENVSDYVQNYLMQANPYLSSID